MAVVLHGPGRGNHRLSKQLSAVGPTRSLGRNRADKPIGLDARYKIDHPGKAGEIAFAHNCPSVAHRRVAGQTVVVGWEPDRTRADSTRLLS